MVGWILFGVAAIFLVRTFQVAAYWRGRARALEDAADHWRSAALDQSAELTHIVCGMLRLSGYTVDVDGHWPENERPN